jgi:hypothetical protein
MVEWFRMETRLLLTVQMRLLIENADLKEIARDQNCTDRTDLDDPWGAWPWKSDFGSRTLTSVPQPAEKSRKGWGWKGRGLSGNGAANVHHGTNITNSTKVSDPGTVADGTSKVQNGRS